MKATTNYGWAHPDPGDHTRTWEYWNTFEDVDQDLKAIDQRSAGGLPALTVIAADINGQPGPVDRAVPFTAITINNGLTGAAIVDGAHLRVPIAGLYTVTLRALFNATEGWGATAAVEKVAGAVPCAAIYTTGGSGGMSLSDIGQVYLVANQDLRLHLVAGGTHYMTAIRATLTRIAPPVA